MKPKIVVLEDDPAGGISVGECQGFDFSYVEVAPVYRTEAGEWRRSAAPISGVFTPAEARALARALNEIADAIDTGMNPV